MRLHAAFLFVVLGSVGFAQAAPTPLPVNTAVRKGAVSYSKDVADIMIANCAGCHGDALAENKLNMEEVAGMIKGGKSGPAIVPGNADKSLLFQMAAHRVEPVMPPKEKKSAKPLSPDELGLLKLWIDAGAKDDSQETSDAAKAVELGSLPPGIQPINAVDLTGDGSMVACGRANVVQVYDVDSGLEIIALGGHKDLIQSVRFSPDARLLAAGSYEIVTLWNVPKVRLETTYVGSPCQIMDIGLLGSTQRYVTAGNEKRVRFWHADGKPRLDAAVPAEVLALDVSTEGAYLLLGCVDNSIRLYDIANGLNLKEFAVFLGHAGPVNDVALLSDGGGIKRVVSASADGSVRVWKIPAKAGEKPANPLVLKGSPKPLKALAVAPEQKRVVAAGESGTLYCWSLDDGTLIKTIDAHDAPINALAFDPVEDDLVLTGSSDKTAKLIDVKTGETKVVYRGHLGAVNAVAFGSPRQKSDQIVTAGAEGGVKVWKKASAKGVIAFGHTGPPNTPIQPVNALLVERSGEVLSGSADKTMKRWKYEGTWNEQRTLGPHRSRVLALDFNPDGTLLAAGAGEPSRSGEVRLWEVGKGIPVRTLDGLHSDTVFGLRFSPDGSRLATAGADKFMKVTRVSDGKELRAFEGHTSHVLALDWKSDGKQIVTGGADNVLKLWDVESGEQLRTLQAAGKQVTAIRWIPGKPQVAGASGDKLVRFWNPDNGSILRTFNGEGDYVFGVAVSNDGARVTAGGADGVLFVWKAENAQVLRKFEPKPAP